MFWQITAIAASITCVYLAWRNRKWRQRNEDVMRANRLLQYGCKAAKCEERVCEFMREGK